MTQTLSLLSRDRLAEMLESEGLPGTADSLRYATLDAARRVAHEAADNAERFGYHDGQTSYLAHELRRWGNLTR